tara:strand:- start:334 stop:1620 length:1287 start_codon:yes stop_codon:yes gene_type:complete
MARRPFFGSSGAVTPARMDMRVATEPGRAYGDLFQNLGRLGGALLKDYGDTKKKRQEDKGFIKGVQPILKYLSTQQPMLADVYSAASESLNDENIPLSQRKSNAVSMLQNISFLQNYRDKQSQISTRERLANLEQTLANLKEKEFNFKTFLEQQNMSVKYDEYLRRLKKDKMDADKARLDLDQTVRPVFNESGEPIPDLFRRGKDLLTKDPRTGRFSELGTGVENVVDRPAVSTPEPSIEKFDPEKGFTKSYGTTLEDIGQSAFRKLGGETQEEILGFKLKGKERLRARQMVRVIGATIRKPLMEVFGGKMTNQQIDLINDTIPLEDDQTEVGMEKLRSAIRLLKQKRVQANDVLRLSNPTTENYAKATSVVKEINSNLPIIEEIVDEYYGNIPTSGMPTMGSISNLDEILKSDVFLKSLPRDTNKTK